MYKNCQKTTFSIAFTLVELLVVISIIGLLAGLAVPAINGGLKSSKAGACLSNLHQIGVATMAYAADNSLNSQMQGVERAICGQLNLLPLFQQEQRAKKASLFAQDVRSQCKKGLIPL